MSINAYELSRYRLEQADQCLKSARVLENIGDTKGAANRSYYCVFHCIRSVLALEKVDFKKHSAVIAYFRREYIKTGLLDICLSDIITELFQIRAESDYDDFYIISRQEVQEQIVNAEFFYNAVMAFVKDQEN